MEQIKNHAGRQQSAGSVGNVGDLRAGRTFFSLVATSATAEGFLGTVMRVPVDVGVLDWEPAGPGGPPS
ncbi:hypothetical protein QW131_34370 [Roseibium salinum]|nr:hypothetical protein [Roseibium salinum]